MKEHRRSLIILFLSSLLSCFLWQPKVDTIRHGLDVSWQLFLNTAYWDNLKWGHDILFTHGPLSLLHFPFPIGHSLLLANVFSFVCQFLFSFSLINLIIPDIDHLKVPLKKQAIAGLIVQLLATICLINFADLTFKWALLPVLLVLNHYRTKGLFYLMFLAALLGVLIQVKVQFFVFGLLPSSLYLLIFTIQHYPRYLRQVGSFVLALIIGSMGLWLLTGQDLAYLPAYLWSLVEFSSGYSSAMSMPNRNNWVLLSLVMLLILFWNGFLFVGRHQHRHLLLLNILFLSSFYLAFKYGFVREGTHVTFFMTFVLCYLLLNLALIDRLVIVPLFIVIVSVPMVVSVHHVIITAEPANAITSKNIIKSLIDFKINGFLNLYEVLLHQDRHKSDALKRSSIDSYAIPESFLREIGNDTVDIYPWESSLIYKHNLNYSTRPVFQTYAAYTPWLDRKNAAFYRSTKSPEYIVWHNGYWHLRFYGIDGRYLLNDEPLTLYEILTRYQLIRKQEAMTLFRKRTQPIQAKRVVSKAKKVKWRQSIAVPIVGINEFVLAKIQINRRFGQKLKMMLYREDPVYIHYAFGNKKVARKRIIVDQAASGIWISPYLNDFSLPKSQYRVKSPVTNIRSFAQIPSTSLKCQIESLSNQKVAGWCFIPDVRSEDTKIYIALRNSKIDYLLESDQLKRTDIADRFKDSRLDYSGFVTEFGKFNIPDDQYQIGVFLVNQSAKKRSASWSKYRLPIHTTQNQINGMNVNSIKLSHGNSDLFEEYFTVEWEIIKLPIYE